MGSTNPPRNDDVIDRHQFYAAISKDTDSLANGVAVIGSKLDGLASAYNEVHDTVQASETRNKTLITVVTVVWIVIGGAVGWYVQRMVGNSDRFTQRFEEVEKKTTAAEAILEKQRDLPERVEAIKRTTADTQRRIDELEVIRK